MQASETIALSKMIFGIILLIITTVLSQSTQFYNDKSTGSRTGQYFQKSNPSNNRYWYNWWYNDNNGGQNSNNQHQQQGPSFSEAEGAKGGQYWNHQDKKELFNIPENFQGIPGLKNGNNGNFLANLVNPNGNNGGQTQDNPYQPLLYNTFSQSLSPNVYQQWFKNGQKNIHQTTDNNPRNNNNNNNNNGGGNKDYSQWHQEYNHQWQKSDGPNNDQVPNKGNFEFNIPKFHETKNNFHRNNGYNSFASGEDYSQPNPDYSSVDDYSNSFPERDQSKDVRTTTAQTPFFWIGIPPPSNQNVSGKRINRTLHSSYPNSLRPGIRRNDDENNNRPGVQRPVHEPTSVDGDLGQIDLLVEGQQFCGQGSDFEDQTSIRISRGHASTQMYPWLVAIYQIGPDNKTKFICGGSLITKKHIISAAHCFIPTESSMQYDFIISNNRILNPNEAQRTLRKASGIMRHPNYNPLAMSANADIAIVLFDRPVEFGQLIKPICLWSGDRHIKRITDEIGRVVGWGADEYIAIADELPMEINMNVLDYNTCISKDNSFVNVVGQNSFCTGYRNGSGPCMGDSGSGFMIMKDGRWTLRGVVSVTTQLVGCDINHYIGITDVAKYNGWINTILRRG